MAYISSAAPETTFDGIEDKSIRTVPEQETQQPQHLAAFFIMSESGPTHMGQVDSSSELYQLYGENTFNKRSQYYNHHTLLLQDILSEGNSVMVKRLLAPGSKKANLTLCADVLTDTDGKVSIKFVTRDMDKTTFDLTTTLEGERKKDALVSTLYPLMRFQATFYGSIGNNLGIRIQVPDNHSLVPPDTSIIDTFHTRMIRVQFIKKANERTAPTVVKTKYGEEYTDVSLTEGVYRTVGSSDQEFYIGDVLLDNYLSDSSLKETYGPFESVEIKHDNLTLVQSLAREAILKKDDKLATELVTPDMVNIWTGTALNSQPYPGLELLTALDGGIVFGEDRNVYATGGDSGKVEAGTHDLLVQQVLNDFMDEDASFEDSIPYPFTHIYDTGFAMETKYAIADVLPKRKDLRVVLATHMATDKKPLTFNEEISRGQALLSRLTGNPESVVYGTKTCRGDIAYLSGPYITPSKWRGDVSIAHDYACNMARFAGAANGRLNHEYAPDRKPNNKVRYLRSLNIKSFNSEKTQAMWAGCGIWARQGDRRSFYYPALRSVYKDDTSVLISPITVNIACDMLRRLEMIHKSFSGNSELSNGQLCERCDEEIEEEFRGKYGERVKYRINTYLDDRDKQRGYSWSTTITLAANNPHNVWRLNLVTQRMDDFTAAE